MHALDLSASSNVCHFACFGSLRFCPELASPLLLHGVCRKWLLYAV